MFPRLVLVVEGPGRFAARAVVTLHRLLLRGSERDRVRARDRDRVRVRE